MLSEIIQRKTNTLCYHCYVKSKKKKQMYVTKTDSQRTNGYQWEVRRAEGQAGVGVRDTNYYA